MANQAVIETGENTLYYNSPNFEDFDPQQNYLIRLERKGCKVRIFRAKVKICGCRYGFVFCINKCIEERGRWRMQILSEAEKVKERKLFYQTTVEVYKA